MLTRNFMNIQTTQKSSTIIRESLFWGFMVVLIYPLLHTGFFPTVDGPAHLYNSNLILDYFFSDNGCSHQLFQFNAEPEPNWLGHFLLAALNSFLPSWLAEKTILLLSIALIPLGFRYLLSQHGRGKSWGIFLAFPLSYTILLYLGFYNFCMSIGLMLFSLGIYEKNKNNYRVRFSFAFLAMMILLYFAHLFSFLVFVAYVFSEFLLRVKNDPSVRSHALKVALKRFWPLIPTLLLSLNFILKKGAAGEVVFLPAETLWTWIKESAVLVALIYDAEHIFTTLLSVLWLLLLLFVITWRLIKKERLNANDLWFVLALLFVGVYFFAPDQMASGGYISLRIALYFTLFVLIWVGLQKLPSWIFIASMAASLLCTLKLLTIHTTESLKLSDDANELYLAAPFIEEGKTVLPLNYSGNWLHSNFATYLGSERKILVLDNYEASTPHFPMKWRENKEPYEVAGDYANSSQPCLTIDRYEKASGIRVDYITQWYWNETMVDSCTLAVDSLLLKNFTLIYTSPQGKLNLYKRK
jgi:hypothetical protein